MCKLKFNFLQKPDFCLKHYRSLVSILEWNSFILVLDWNSFAFLKICDLSPRTNVEIFYLLVVSFFCELKYEIFSHFFFFFFFLQISLFSKFSFFETGETESKNRDDKDSDDESATKTKRNKKKAVLSDSDEEDVPRKKAKVPGSDDESGKSRSGSDSEAGSGSEGRKKKKKRIRIGSGSEDVRLLAILARNKMIAMTKCWKKLYIGVAYYFVSFSACSRSCTHPKCEVALALHRHFKDELALTLVHLPNMPPRCLVFLFGGRKNEFADQKWTMEKQLICSWPDSLFFQKLSKFF